MDDDSTYVFFSTYALCFLDVCSILYRGVRPCYFLFFRDELNSSPYIIGQQGFPLHLWCSHEFG